MLIVILQRQKLLPNKEYESKENYGLPIDVVNYIDCWND
jgi:hypothetical protein